MEPVPLVPDAEGNWEPLVSEIWTDVEKMSKLAETNFKAELSRFRDFSTIIEPLEAPLRAMEGRYPPRRGCSTSTSMIKVRSEKLKTTSGSGSSPKGSTR